MRSFFRLLKNDSATALSQQLADPVLLLVRSDELILQASALRDKLRGHRRILSCALKPMTVHQILGTPPEHVILMTLPELQIARSYPTIGPQGTTNEDINGSACSMELYLGADVLTASDGTLIPTRWTGYIGPMMRYQGVLVAKDRVQQLFDEKIQDAMRDPSGAGEYDFRGIESIFQAILHEVASR